MELVSSMGRARGRSGGVNGEGGGSGADGVNGETRISGGDGDNGERGESPHAEGGRAWPSCLSIGSLISAYSL